jgi:hypothetical protein
MSYESEMLKQLGMPSRKVVEQALLRSLLKHDGVVKEFGGSEEIVEEIAHEFHLTEVQRSAILRIALSERKSNQENSSLASFALQGSGLSR